MRRASSGGRAQGRASRHGARHGAPARIAKLKGKGVAFGLITGDEAAARLSDRTPSERRVGCELDGRYANLGLGRLKLLASLDRAPRNTLPPLTLDVERFARAKLVLEVAERPDGDGRPAFSGHLAALNRRRRNRRAGEIKALSEVACCGAPVEKFAFPDDMPLWVYLEPVALSAPISSVRSAGATGACAGNASGYVKRRLRGALLLALQNRSTASRAGTAIFASANVMRAPSDAEISRRVVSANMRDPRQGRYRETRGRDAGRPRRASR